MILKNYLKLTAICIVSESKLTNKAKRSLLPFIESEASEKQLSAFIKTGRICSEGSEIDLKEILPIVVGAFIYSKIFKKAKEIYNLYFSKKSKECAKRYKGSYEKRTCVINAMLGAERQRLGSLKKDLSQCNKMNNPDKCKKLIFSHIKKVEKKIYDLQKQKMKT